MLPIIIAILPPRISAGALPLSRTASIRTLAPSPTAFGSKITSTLMKKNYASQSRRGLGVQKGCRRIVKKCLFSQELATYLLASDIWSESNRKILPPFRTPMRSLNQLDRYVARPECLDFQDQL